MAEQIKTKKEQLAEKEAEMLAEVDAVRQEEIRSQAEEKISDIDDLLDEIDGVLEENAADFVDAFRQKGGQAVRVALGWLDRLWTPRVRLL